MVCSFFSRAARTDAAVRPVSSGDGSSANTVDNSREITKRNAPVERPMIAATAKNI